MRRAAPSVLGRLLVLITAIVATSALSAAPALADGDPASDILVTQSAWTPWDAGVSAPAQAQLQQTVSAANRAGFPIKVALIAGSKDLGTVPQLWGKPRAYVNYLGTELSELWRGQLLVVMPAGFGLYGPGSGANRLTATETAVKAPAPAAGDRLATSATAAVERLAAAFGRPFRAPGAPAAAAPATAPASPWPWVALGAGLLAVLAAWGASLRSRPLRPRLRAQA